MKIVHVETEASGEFVIRFGWRRNTNEATWLVLLGGVTVADLTADRFILELVPPTRTDPA